jgi:hypothetical protein
LSVVANFRGKFTSPALDDVAQFKKRERKAILDGIDKQPIDEPHVETRNRKRLRPNRTNMIGEKRGNMVLVRGEEYEL